MLPASMVLKSTLGTHQLKLQLIGLLIWVFLFNCFYLVSVSMAELTTGDWNENLLPINAYQREAVIFNL